jgi:diacylglycerol kinase family enzyme
MRRLLLTANPTASAFTGALHRRVVEELGETFAVTAVWPTTPDLARSMAAEAAADGFDVVVAMGGDGVVHHVANGIANTSTALGIIPAGTTNVVARIIGMPAKPSRAAGILATAEVATIPLAHLATDSSDGARSVHAVFAAGVGYDAEMVHIADQRPSSKLYFGSWHYARSAAGALLSRSRRRTPNLRVDCDGDRVDAVSVLIQVHDPYTYLGRIPLRLAPKPGAGLTVLAIESLRLPRAASIVARAALGRRIERVEGVHVWRDPAKLVIEAEPASRFQADGELLGSTDWLEVSPVPNGLRVLTPAAEASDQQS